MTKELEEQLQEAEENGNYRDMFYLELLAENDTE